MGGGSMGGLHTPLKAYNNAWVPFVVETSISFPSLENLSPEMANCSPRSGANVKKGPLSYARTSKSCEQ